MSRRWIASRLDGTQTIHSSLAALNAAKRRAKGQRTIVSSWPENDGPPTTSDARDWDAWRLRRGVAS